MEKTKVVTTNVTSEMLTATQGGVGGGDDLLVVRCPANYDAAKITAWDIVSDDAIETVPREMSLSYALHWARTAEAGDYLTTYEISGNDDRDTGSRCGLGDDEIDDISERLGRRGLRLVADDVGLVAKDGV